MKEIEKIVTKENKWIYCDYKFSQILCLEDKILIYDKNINYFYFFYILISSFIVLHLVFLYQFFFKKKNFPKNNSIFLKVGEGNDYKNINYINKLKNKKLFIIDSYNIRDNFKIANINYIIFLKHYFKCIISFKQSLKYQTKPNSKFIYNNIKNKIVLHSYYNSFYHKIKKIRPNIECFTSGSWFQSLSIIKNNIPIYFLTHGLLGRFSSTIIPRYNYVCVFSNYEKKFIEKNYFFKNILIYEYKTLKNHNNSIIIFLRQSIKLINKDDILKIIKYFKNQSFKIFIKEHPNKHFNFQDYFSINDIHMIDSSELAYDILYKFNPKFVFGYFSTALCQSLNVGIIPITLGSNDEIKKKYKTVKITEWTIYPFKEKTLSWNKNFKQIESTLTNEINYNKILDKLKNEH